MIERRGFSWKSWAVGVGCGAVVVFVTGAAPNNQAATGRYQISAWARPGTANGEAGASGAYRLDTQTGEVYAIDGFGNPSKINIPQ